MLQPCSLRFVSLCPSGIVSILFRDRWTRHSFHCPCGSSRINWSYASPLCIGERKRERREKKAIIVGQTSPGCSKDGRAGGKERDRGRRRGGLKGDREEENILIKTLLALGDGPDKRVMAGKYHHYDTSLSQQQHQQQQRWDHLNLLSPSGGATLELSAAAAADGDVIEAFNRIPHWQQSAPATFHGLGRPNATRKAANCPTAARRPTPTFRQSEQNQPD